MQPYIQLNSHCIGKSHLAKEMPCEDYSLSYGDNSLSAAVVSDGHGDANCFRSSAGAKFACESCVSLLRQFQGVNSHITDIRSCDFEENVRSLEREIVVKWKKKVLSDAASNPFSAEELEQAAAEVREQYRNGRNIEHAYGCTLIAVMVLSTGIAVGCAGFLTSGIKPTGEEIVRVLIFLIYTVIYICFWLAMALLFSVFTRHAATSALASIALWLFFAIFMSLLAGILANAAYPVNTEYEQAFNSLNNYNLNLNLNRISPYYLYSEAASVLMNPATRAINAVSYTQLVGALSSYLSLGQSLLLVWPHLVGLLALTFAAFTISYVGFMRQEIRGN